MLDFQCGLERELGMRLMIKGKGKQEEMGAGGGLCQAQEHRKHTQGGTWGVAGTGLQLAHTYHARSQEQRQPRAEASANPPQEPRSPGQSPSTVGRFTTCRSRRSTSQLVSGAASERDPAAVSSVRPTHVRERTASRDPFA